MAAIESATGTPARPHNVAYLLMRKDGDKWHSETVEELEAEAQCR